MRLAGQAGEERAAPEHLTDFWGAVAAHCGEFNRGRERLFEQLIPSLRRVASGGDGLSDWAEGTLGLVTAATLKLSYARGHGLHALMRSGLIANIRKKLLTENERKRESRKAAERGDRLFSIFRWRKFRSNCCFKSRSAAARPTTRVNFTGRSSRKSKR